MKKNTNILVLNLKGGSGKTANSSLIVSYLKNASLIEIDKINKSADGVDTNNYFKTQQVNFKNHEDNNFIEFENLLLSDGIKVLDIGAVMLDVFHDAMVDQNLYGNIDLLIVPAMDGSDDFRVALKLLRSLVTNKLIDASKILISLNRFVESVYSSPKEQFDVFFDNVELLKNEFGIDLDNEDNYYTLKENRSVKFARRNGVTLRSIAERDIDEITKRQRSVNDADRLEVTKERVLVHNAQKFQEHDVIPALEKIMKKLEGKKKEAKLEVNAHGE